MTQDQLVTNKKVRSYEFLGDGVQELINIPNKSLMITDIVVSTSDDKEIKFFMDDGENSVLILFMREKGTKVFNFPTGFLYWKGASLKCEKFSQRTVWITVGYLVWDGDKYEKWKLQI